MSEPQEKVDGKETDVESTMAKIKSVFAHATTQFTESLSSGDGEGGLEAGSRRSGRFKSMPRPKSFRSIGRAAKSIGGVAREKSGRLPHLLSFRQQSKTSQTSIESPDRGGAVGGSASSATKMSGAKRRQKNLSRRSVLTPDLLDTLNGKGERDASSSVSSGNGVVSGVGETLKHLVSVGSRANMKPHLSLARERASTAASSAAVRVSQAPGRLRRGLSESVTRGFQDTLGRKKLEPLNPHPHKGLLREGKEISMHLLLLMNMPLHSDLTMDIAFSQDGLFAASGGGPEDRNIHLLFRNTLKFRNPELARTTTLTVAEDDYVSAFSFSPSSLHLICAMGRRRSIMVFQLFRRPDSLPKLEFSFPTGHIYPINSVVIRDTLFNGMPFVATCADDGDNFIKFWSQDGRLMYAHENSDDVANRKLLISNDGKLVALAAHLNSATKLFSLTRGERGRMKKMDTIVEVNQVGEMLGPTDGAVRDVTILSDNRTALVCSEDGTWSKFELDSSGHDQPVRLGYLESADPGKFLAIDARADCSVVVLGRGRDLLFYRGSGVTFGTLICTIPDAHDSEIAKVIVSPDSSCVLTMGIDSVHARLWDMPK